MKKALRQWHLPFQNALQIVLEKDEGHYEMTSERELTRKPLRVDILLLKREDSYHMKSSLGKLLKKYNILEYKGYGDYLNIDDYYKGLSYAFLYKAEGLVNKKHSVNQIAIYDISLLFICYPFPRKLIKHLKARVTVKELEAGVYQIYEHGISIHIIIQNKLKNPEYLWLKNLSCCVQPEDFAKMAEEAQKEPNNRAKDELFQFIGENNEALWKGETKMCKIFEEIEERGVKKGEEIGENRLASLIQLLTKEQRYEDIALASSDVKKRHELYQVYGI